MRYIGNKTKLLPFIGAFLEKKEIWPARAFDAFSGTAAVGSFLKSRGASVVSCDLMAFSYVFQRAYIVADAFPPLTGLADDPELAAARRRQDFRKRVDQRITARHAALDGAGARGALSANTRALDEVLVFLDTYLDPCTSFIARHFAAPLDADGDATWTTSDPGADRTRDIATATASRGGTTTLRSTHGARRFFTLERARRIDAVRHRIHDWHSAGAITDDEQYLLLAALLEGADAVANTAGVYAAFIKQWQANALREFRLPLPRITLPTLARRSRGASAVTKGSRAERCEAHLGDVLAVARDAGRFDLLYLDPPYNTRQYSAYYHVPELIAMGWFVEQPPLRGKTGLPPNEGKKSIWSTRARAVPALEQLLATADADHVLLSYNSEGIIPDGEIERLFRGYGRRGTFSRVARQYPRYRADRPSETRRYKAREVRENLYYVRMK